MLTGQKLGRAIAEAIKKKGITKADLARHFGIKPPSISDWCNRGTIDKAKLEPLFAYFSDVVGPEHWGLSSPLTASHIVAHQSVADYKVARDNGIFLTSTEHELIGLLREMTPSGQCQLLGMAKILASQMPRTKAKAAG